MGGEELLRACGIDDLRRFARVVEAMINVTKWGLTARWNKLRGKQDSRQDA